MAHDCSGHKKDMAFLADQIKPYMDRDTDVVMADGACAGMLKILERLFPWEGDQPILSFSFLFDLCIAVWFALYFCVVICLSA